MKKRTLLILPFFLLLIFQCSHVEENIKQTINESIGTYQLVLAESAMDIYVKDSVELKDFKLTLKKDMSSR